MLSRTLSGDTYGHREKIYRAGGAGAVTTLVYDIADRIHALSQNFAATANDVELTPSYSYNPSPQMVGQGVDNDAYVHQPPAADRAYLANGLNPYSKVGGGAYAYNQNGNLTSNYYYSYTYDPENRLLTASGPTAVTLTYDPLGRLQTSAASGATTSFLFDGDNLVEENDSSGNTLQRYVPGPDPDEPLVWYQGASLANPHWPAADGQGSIIGYADASGNSQATYTYDPYGNPDSWGGSRYRYTGQLTIPEAHLYYYKARIYDPFNGRFLQTDPVGYDADVNLYAYANNDPVNGSDPSGMATIICQNCEPTSDVAPVIVNGNPPPPPPPRSGYTSNPAGVDFVTTFLVGVTSTVNGSTIVQELVLMFHKGKPNKFSGALGPQNTHQYHISVPTLCSAGQAFSDLKDAGMSAPGAPAAREGFTPRINLTGNNPISQYVNSSTRTIINTTLPTHVFYPGNVTIQVVPAAGGTSDINITGTGSGNDPFLNDLAGYGFFQFVSANSVAQVCAARAGVPGP